MEPPHNPFSDNDDPDGDEEIRAAAEQVRRLTETMLKQRRLCANTLTQMIQDWTTRREGSVRESLEELKEFYEKTEKYNEEQVAKEYRKLWLGDLSKLQKDAMDSMFLMMLLAQRNLWMAQREMGKEAQAMSKEFKERAGFDPLKDSVVAGFREATAPAPLVNYEGYLTCNITVDGKGCMVGDGAQIDERTFDLIAQVELMSGIPSNRAWSKLVVNQGIDSPSLAVFEVEASSDDMLIPHELVRLKAVSGGSSSQKQIALQVSPDAPKGQIILKLFVSQAGRHISVMRVPIYRGVSETDSATSRPEVSKPS
jgi:hypothetical protein